MFGKFKRNRKGVTTVESAIIAVLTIAIILSAATLYYATTTMSRLEAMSKEVEELSKDMAGLSGDVTTTSASVDKILEILGAPPPKEYACPYCPAVFKTEADLAAHIREAHPPVMEVKVGIVYPLSGALAASGKMIRDVVDFAIREINEAGGIKSLGGARIAAIWADSKGKPETGADEAERLITEENVVAVFGCYQSSVTYAASEVNERYSVPFLNPESSSPKLTGGPGTGYDPRGAKWFFRTGPHDVQFAMVMFKFLEDVQKETGITVSTIATVCEDTLYGKTAADTVKRLNTELGYNYELVADILYPHEAASVDAEVMALKAANPDVVWMASYLHDAMLFQAAYKALDFNPKLLLVFDAGHTHPDFYKIPESGYVASRLAWNWDVKKANSMAVDKKFYDVFGYHMLGYQAREYTGMYALYWALEEAGKVASPEDLEAFRTAIKDALLAFDVPGEDIIMPWAGIKFDENGQNMHATGVQGQLFWTTPEGAPLEAAEYYTVWPFEVASRKYVFPQPTWAER